MNLTCPEDYPSNKMKPEFEKSKVKPIYMTKLYAFLNVIYCGRMFQHHLSGLPHNKFLINNALKDESSYKVFLDKSPRKLNFKINKIRSTSI